MTTFTQVQQPQPESAEPHPPDHTSDQGTHHHEHHDGHRGVRPFLRHYLGMVVAMLVGMAVLGAALRGALALMGIEFSMDLHPELVTIEMAFDMSVGMVVWMRYRGHGWAPTLEMTGAMFAPGIAILPLFWADVISTGSLMALEHSIMFPLMLLVMLRRRTEYGG